MVLEPEFSIRDLWPFTKIHMNGTTLMKYFRVSSYVSIAIWGCLLNLSPRHWKAINNYVMLAHKKQTVRFTCLTSLSVFELDAKERVKSKFDLDY